MDLKKKAGENLYKWFLICLLYFRCLFSCLVPDRQFYLLCLVWYLRKSVSMFGRLRIVEWNAWKLTIWRICSRRTSPSLHILFWSCCNTIINCISVKLLCTVIITFMFISLAQSKSAFPFRIVKRLLLSMTNSPHFSFEISYFDEQRNTKQKEHTFVMNFSFEQFNMSLYVVFRWMLYCGQKLDMQWDGQPTFQINNCVTFQNDKHIHEQIFHWYLF